MYKLIIPKLKYLLGGYGLRKNFLVTLLINSIKPRKVKVSGHTFYLNRGDTTVLEKMLSGSYEPEQTELFKNVVHPGDIVLDIGANVGYYTLLFAKTVGPYGLVYAFEPDPTNFKLLKKNIEVNGYNNIKAFPFAVSNSTRKGFLYLNDYNAGDHRIFDSKNNRKTVPIEIISLRDRFPNLRPNFIKIDTQGAEVEILKGIKNIIDDVHSISIEYWPYGLNKAGYTGKDLCNILTDYGFVYELNPNLYTIENEKSTDILATK